MVHSGQRRSKEDCRVDKGLEQRTYLSCGAYQVLVLPIPTEHAEASSNRNLTQIISESACKVELLLRCTHIPPLSPPIPEEEQSLKPTAGRQSLLCAPDV